MPTLVNPISLPMAEYGDMFVNRKNSNALLRVSAPRLIGFGKAQRFAPDILLTEGSTLTEYGLNARVVAIPGHSKGSIGILTDEGALLCGDLYESIKRPALNSLMDDIPAALASDARVRSMGIRIVYPGGTAPHSRRINWPGRRCSLDTSRRRQVNSQESLRPDAGTNKDE